MTARRLPRISLRRPLKILLVTVLIGIASFFVFTPIGHAYLKAGLLVEDILSGSPQSLLRIVTPPTVMTTITIDSPQGPNEARLYRPDDASRHSAVILSLGYPSNIQDRQLNLLADGLSRLGFVVMLPRLPGLQVGELVPQDVEVLVATFEWLSAQSYVDQARIGFSGFCVGSSLALVAAQDPRINERVSMVNVFGGYYDLPGLLRAIAAHSARYQDREYPWQPADQTVELFAQNVLLHLAAGDQALLKQHYQNPNPAAQAPAGLSPIGRIAFSLLTARGPSEVDALIAQLPPETLLKMAAVSPSTGMARLKARIYIMHDVSDPYVPLTESYRLADAISDPNQVVRAEFVLFDHVRPSHTVDQITLLAEGARLFGYFGQVFGEMMPAE